MQLERAYERTTKRKRVHSLNGNNQQSGRITRVSFAYLNKFYAKFFSHGLFFLFKCHFPHLSWHDLAVGVFGLDIVARVLSWWVLRPVAQRFLNLYGGGSLYKLITSASTFGMELMQKIYLNENPSCWLPGWLPAQKTFGCYISKVLWIFWSVSDNIMLNII